MYSRIPEHIIEEIRSRADIVDVVSEHVALKKRGKNLFGLCPFHQDKKPSFSVSPERQIYRCFSCGVGGNVFKFLMELEKVSFVEAVRSLAEKTGVKMPAQEHDREDPNDAVYRANQLALDYYCQVLLQTNAAKHARDYLAGRQVDDGMISTFKLGYAPESWDDLLKLGRKNGFDDDTMVEAGLAIRNEEKGRVYNRFRNRLMFPIFHPGGRVIAFGGRTLGDDMAKYMNSPETPIYHKSNVLYGMNWAKGAARLDKTVIVAEGYMDMMRIYSAGFKNVVSASGTAFTPEQARQISRYAEKVLIVYDSDAAGQEATIRGLDVLVQAGLDVGVVTLDEGKDPDEFILRRSPEAFGEALAAAADIIDYKIAYYSKTLDITSVDGKSRTVREIMSTVGKVRDPIRRSFLVKKVAETFGLDESMVRGELKTEQPAPRQRHYRDEPPPPDDGYMPPEEDDNVENALPIPREELGIVRLLLSDSQISIKGEPLIAYVKDHVSAKEFTHPSCESIVTNVYDRYKRKDIIDPALLIEEMAAALKQEVLAQYFIDDDDTDMERLLLDNIARLKVKRLDRELRRLQGELKSAQAEGRTDRVAALVEKLTVLTKEKMRVAKV